MKTHLYRHFNSNNELLYVGISLSAFNRLSQHKESSKWFEEISNVTIQSFDNREDALKSERIAVQEENPKYNVRLRKTTTQLRREERSKLLKHLTNAEVEEYIDRPTLQKNELINRFVRLELVYTVDEVRNFLRMRAAEVDHYIASGLLSSFTISGKYSTKLNNYKPKVMISGWSLIDFIDYLENK